MSLSVSEEVDISGDDSQKALLPSSDWSCKPSFENFSSFGFGVDIGVELPSMMLPSEKHLLTNDLKSHNSELPHKLHQQEHPKYVSHDNDVHKKPI